MADEQQERREGGGVVRRAMYRIVYSSPGRPGRSWSWGAGYPRRLPPVPQAFHPTVWFVSWFAPVLCSGRAGGRQRQPAPASSTSPVLCTCPLAEREIWGGADPKEPCLRGMG